MHKTILKIIWPYVLRYLAQRSATYLDQRHERKRQQEEAAAHGPAEPVIAAGAIECAPASSASRLSTTNAVWYTLSGVLLGSAIGLILATVLREEG